MDSLLSTGKKHEAAAYKAGRQQAEYITFGVHSQVTDARKKIFKNYELVIAKEIKTLRTLVYGSTGSWSRAVGWAALILESSRHHPGWKCVAKEVVSKIIPSPASRYLLAQHHPRNSFSKACKTASQPATSRVISNDESWKNE